MAGTDSKIGIWTETTVEGQPYWHSSGIEDRLPGYAPPSGELTLTGTIAQGEVVTITTDGTYNFGTRENAKPLYVYAGENSKNGSSLGRDTDDYFHATAAFSTAYPIGELPGAIIFDHKVTTGAFWEGLIFDPEKPLFAHGLKYRDFDMTDPDYRTAGGGFNLKTHRIWVTASPTGPNNFYIGYQGSEGGNCRAFAENTGGSAIYYSGNPPVFEWHDEALLFKNASGVDLNDGRFHHLINGALLNNDTNQTLTRTISTTNPNPLKAFVLDQLTDSNAGVGVSNIYNCLATFIVDDEPKQIWVGNADTWAGSTIKHPIPTTAWNSTSVSAHILEGRIAAANMYFYVMTDWDLDTGVQTLVSTNGVR